MKTKRKLLSLLLCGTMLFSLCVQPIVAEVGTQTQESSITPKSEGLCEHHSEHTKDCGYAKGESEALCRYVCMECEKAEIPQDKESDVVLNVQIMINSLPSLEEIKNRSLDGQRKAYDCLQAVCDAYESLSNEEQKQIEGTEILEELSHWFNDQTELTTEIDAGDFDGFHWTLDDNGTLTITGSGDMPSLVYDPAWLKDHENDIKKVVVENGITSIGNSAFYLCTNLVSVNLPDSLTSIEDHAFCYCTSLAQIELPDSITSIGNSAFFGCTNLTLTNLPTDLTSIGQLAFYKCTNLALTELPDSLTSIKQQAFTDCTSLKQIKLPANLISIKKETFSGCTSLTLVELPDSLISIEEKAFNGCTSLTSIELPDSLTAIGNNAFYQCTSLALTELPDSLTMIGDYAFFMCSSLALTKLSDSLTAIGKNAFNGCSNLALTKLPENLASIGSFAFWYCTSLVSMELPDSLTLIEDYAFGGCTSLTEIIVTNTSAPTLGNKVFDACKALRTIYVLAEATGYTAENNWPVDIIKFLTAPSFTVQPESADVTEGQTATFTVTANGEPVPTYQWQVNKDGCSWENISDATNSSYTTAATDKSMDGWKYQCIATNRIGDTTSKEAILTVKSTDAGIQIVSVDGTEGTINGTTITAVLPYGKTLPTENSKISITPAAGAAVSALATTDNGATWTFTVTAEDGTTTANYTIMVSNAPNPAAENIADVAKAKSTIQSTSWTVDQSTANTKAAVKSWIENQLNGMSLNDVDCTVSITDFTAATAGNRANTDGTDGSFTFTVSLSKGADSTLATDTTVEINGTITAMPYQMQIYMVSVSASPTEGGMVSGGGTYTENNSVTVTASAKDGYHFVKWMENGSEVSTNASYIFTIIDNHTLIAIFEQDSTPPQPIQYRVMIQAEAGGTASASPTSAEQGTEITLTATPDSGYHFKEWQVISGDITISGNRFTMPDANVSVKAVFEKDSTPPQPTPYNITIQTETGGTASASSTSATAGTEIILTATPDSGYHFKEWQVISGGVTISGDCFIMPATNVTIKAVFKKDSSPPQPIQYRVTIQAGTGGTASGSSVSATAGTEITLTATPDSGYHFKEWQVISGGVTISNNRFIMPAANVTVKAVFEQEITPPQPIQYNVTINNSYATANGSGSYEAGATVSIHAGSRSNYRFNGWTSSDGIRFANAGNTSTTFIMPDKAVTVMATWTYIGENSDSEEEDDSSSDDSDSSDDSFTMAEHPDKTKPEIPVISQTKQIIPDADGNAVVDNDTVLSAIQTAKDEAKKNGTLTNGVAISVPVTAKADQTSFSVTIKTQAIHTIAQEEVKRLEIVVGGMIVEGMSTDLVKWLDTTSGNGDIIFRMKQTEVLESAQSAIGTRPVYDLSMVYLSNGKETPILDFGGHTFTIRLPYTPTKEEQTGNLYAVYVDNAGKVEWLTKSSYDPNLGAVVFETGHFSVYGVGYKTPVSVFTDITGHWAANNILFAVSRGLFPDTGNNQFSPNTGMTRGMFVTALGRLEDINLDNYKIGGKFTDVKADAYYAPYVNWAAEKGIINSITTTAFSPDGNITREQMAVIMINYANQLGYDLPVTQEAVTFADNKQISSWAAAEVKAMQQAGILAGKDGNRFDPQGNATRAEAATVLRRFVEIVIDSQTAQGWMQNHSGSWQYRRNGKAVTGWLYNNKKWYWLDEKGWMFHGGWKQIDGKYYYFYSDGSMAANTMINGRKIGSDGAEYQ